MKQRIKTTGSSLVASLTSLGDQLFVLRAPTGKQIEVYQYKEGKYTLNEEKALRIPRLSSDKWGGNSGLAACGENQCLYVSDYHRDTVYRLELTDQPGIISWRVDSSPRGLSINSDGNLLVACFKAKKIQEYETRGVLIREIHLHLRPDHAIELFGKQYVICGMKVKCFKMENDVIEVDANGEFIFSYKYKLASTKKPNFSFVSHIATDENRKCVFVADFANNRIMLLQRAIDEPHPHTRELKVSVRGGLDIPSCIHYDESQDRLFVGEGGFNERRIFLFEGLQTIINSFP